MWMCITTFEDYWFHLVILTSNSSSLSGAFSFSLQEDTQVPSCRHWFNLQDFRGEWHCDALRSRQLRRFHSLPSMERSPLYIAPLRIFQTLSTLLFKVWIVSPNPFQTNQTWTLRGAQHRMWSRCTLGVFITSLLSPLVHSRLPPPDAKANGHSRSPPKAEILWPFVKAIPHSLCPLRLL